MSRTKKSSPGNDKKRKASEAIDTAEDVDIIETTAQPPPSKRAKDPKKPSAKDATLDTSTSINTAFAHMNPDILADHLAAQTKKFQSDLSLVELEEIRLPVAALRDTTDFVHERTLAHMPDFLRGYCTPKRAVDDLSRAAKAHATPHTLVVTGAGLRAAEVTRALRVFQTKDATVAKLFAKHIKLAEAKEFVAKTRMGIGVGTPKRIADLLDDGVLVHDRLERIVVDVSHIDLKKRGILDMKELQAPLMELLNRKELRERYGVERKGIELLFY